jgi:shikimate dehydrogenase
LLFGVLGYPVAHSLSPTIQAAAFAAAGIDARYFKLPVPPELFEETARSLPGSGYRGANVTIPHKRAALRLADVATPTALAVGAANTLTFEDGRIEADNTDAGGFLAAIDGSVEGYRAVVLGAGGAARAVVWALKNAGAAHVFVWNRTEARARALAADLGVSVIAQPIPCDLLVNATSVGLHPGDDVAALGLDKFEPPRIVADLVYSGAGETPVAVWGRRGGARVIDGVEMLVRQGALSFERWTGRAPSLEAMRASLRGA